jgi:flagellar motor protein MotB
MRLSTAGRGELDPVAPNATEAGRQANRRVEIYVEAVVQG